MLVVGGYEIVDKNFKCEIFFGGELVEYFCEDVKKLIVSEFIVEEVDDFFGKFDMVMM